MKKLTEYLHTNSILEAFGGELVKKLALGMNKRARDGGWAWSLIMFDKVHDDDLKPITKEEALKAMRSRKDPGYIIWYDSKHNETNISWGFDVIATYDNYIKDVKTIWFANESDEFYLVENPERFFRKDIRRERIEQKEGALALKDNLEIAHENAVRYKKELMNLEKSRVEGDIKKKVTDSLEKYSNTISEWIPKFLAKCQEGTPSYLDINWAFSYITSDVKDLVEQLAHLNYSWDKKDIIKKCEKIDNSIVNLDKDIEKFLATVE